MNFSEKPETKEAGKIEDVISAIKKGKLAKNNYFEFNDERLVYEGIKKVEVFSKEIEVYEFTILSAFLAKVSIGTTGLKGGDSGHGGRTYLSIKPDIETETFAPIEMFLAGDMELQTLDTTMSLFKNLFGHNE